MQWCRNTECRSYAGARTLDAFTQYAKQMTGEPVQKLSSIEAFQELSRGGADPSQRFGDTQFVLFDAQQASSDATTAYRHVATVKQGLHLFGVVNTNEEWAAPLLQQYSIDKSKSSIVALYEHSEHFVKPLVLDTASTNLTALQQEIKSYVSEHEIPLLPQLSGENFDAITSGHKREFVVLMALDFDDQDSTRQLTSVDMLRLIEKYKSRAMFATVDGVKFTRYLSQYGITTQEHALPQIVALHFPDYFYNVPLTGEHAAPSLTLRSVPEVEKFLSQVIDKRVIAASAVHPWWSPNRYVKQIERALSQYDETTLIIGVVTSTLALLIALGAICWKCGLLGDEGAQDDANLLTARERAALNAGAVQGKAVTPQELTAYQRSLGLKQSYAKALADKEADEAEAKNRPKALGQQTEREADLRQRLKTQAATATVQLE